MKSIFFFFLLNLLFFHINDLTLIRVDIQLSFFPSEQKRNEKKIIKFDTFILVIFLFPKLNKKSLNCSRKIFYRIKSKLMEKREYLSVVNKSYLSKRKCFFFSSPDPDVSLRIGLRCYFPEKRNKYKKKRRKKERIFSFLF